MSKRGRKQELVGSGGFEGGLRGQICSKRKGKQKTTV